MNQWDDQEWFNSIYHSTQKQLSLAMLRIVRNHPLLKDNVDELLADTYYELYRNREKLRTHPNLCAWLITTLKYKSYDKLREKLQECGNRDWLAEIDEYSTASNVLSPEDAYIRKETIREIRKMISDTIGEKGLMVMEAHYCHHISLKELAARMGMSHSALKMQMYRWRRKLGKRGWKI